LGPRVIIAFAVAPAVIPLVVVAIGLVEGVPVPESLLLGLIYAAFRYGAALVFGVPSFRVFSRRGWVRLWQYVVVGALIGLVMLLLIGVMVGELLFGPLTVLVFAAGGALSTIGFWMIAVWDGSRRSF
jgi:hypothetical protein